jgi:hypothetical protein
MLVDVPRLTVPRTSWRSPEFGASREGGVTVGFF